MSTRKTMMIVTTGATSLAIAGVVGLTSVSAANMPTKTGNGAQKREQRYEQVLGEAVTEGKLTSAQEQAIIAEHNQLMSELKSATTKSARRAERKTVRSEAMAWAKQNNLSGRWLLAPRRLRG
jgi:hypothetical protein